VTVLVLGGTEEARELAGRTEVLSSLASSVDADRPEGDLRVGRFGGAEGLSEFLSDRGITAVVDATHPFSAGISAYAAAACAELSLPLLRLVRPGCAVLPQAGRWHWVESHVEAAEVAASLGERTFLCTGRPTLDAFTSELIEVVARVFEPAVDDATLPEGWLLLLDRGPHTLQDERAILVDHGIDVVVTNDLGDETRPTLDAADELEIDVVVVRRPPGPEGVPEVGSVDEALTWVQAQPRLRP
jgi:precorrin-6A/cobalt-precorrin-6A reductase